MKHASESYAPIMQQYLQIKDSCKDCILFFRLGDFYELFFEDAIKAAPILEITLTQRSYQNGAVVPMCGVPYHSSEFYINKLVKNLYKVAICEQLEMPEQAKKRGSKALVNREIVRIITPGTAVEENILSSGESNYLASIAHKKDQIAIAWSDITTNEFYFIQTNLGNLGNELSRINPRECIIPHNLFRSSDYKELWQEWSKILSVQADNIFTKSRAEKNLLEYYHLQDISIIQNITDLSATACGSLIEYLLFTHKNKLPKLGLPKIFRSNNFMSLDRYTRHNLELIKTHSDMGVSLFSILNKCATPGGGRMMQRSINYPLRSIEAINNRLDIVEFFFKMKKLRGAIYGILSTIPDGERATARLCMNRGSPADMKKILLLLMGAKKIRQYLEENLADVPQILSDQLGTLTASSKYLDLIDSALKDQSPLGERNFIAQYYSAELDHFNKLRFNAEDEINILRSKYREMTQLPSLKIEYNQQMGYYIEVTLQQSSKISDPSFEHRQTLKNNVRYSTIELRQLEMDIVAANERSAAIENQIWLELSEHTRRESSNIYEICHLIARIDFFASLAQVAEDYAYIRPIIDDSKDLVIEKGRHPIVEHILRSKHEIFASNDCSMDDGRMIWLITAPNMAGKSTFLRQNALIVLMSQMGSFVPASYARVGLVDAIFSRIGASDDLAKGHSTFMMEMIEASNILTYASDRSLVILDELGRGTSTYDGMAIAWACLEYLSAKIKARTLFATHYHELTELEGKVQGIYCATMAVQEWEGKVIFHHNICAGKADRSYGIYVARLAGLPGCVIARAEDILSSLESK